MGEVAGRDGEQAGEIGEAIDGLWTAGLVHLIDGQFLLATRAARYAYGLGL